MISYEVQYVVWIAWLGSTVRISKLEIFSHSTGWSVLCIVPWAWLILYTGCQEKKKWDIQKEYCLGSNHPGDLGVGGSLIGLNLFCTLYRYTSAIPVLNLTGKWIPMTENPLE